MGSVSGYGGAAGWMGSVSGYGGAAGWAVCLDTEERLDGQCVCIDKEMMVNLLEKNNQQLKNNVSSQDDTLEFCDFSMLASHRLILRNLNYKISLTHFTKIMNDYGIYSPKIRARRLLLFI